jgi:hypothetical protein
MDYVQSLVRLSGWCFVPLRGLLLNSIQQRLRKCTYIYVSSYVCCSYCRQYAPYLRSEPDRQNDRTSREWWAFLLPLLYQRNCYVAAEMRSENRLWKLQAVLISPSSNTIFRNDAILEHKSAKWTFYVNFYGVSRRLYYKNMTRKPSPVSGLMIL